jgi:UDP-N-acetyl-D-glucosamine/UDP-N-acetyl-D-galactosamine dehydrogenase
MKKKNNIIGVIGCGYVGLPLIFLLSRHFNVVGYDTNTIRINELLQNKDTNELKKPFFHKKKNVFFTSDFNDVKECKTYIVTLPTPLNYQNLPNLTAIKNISKKISRILKKNDLVVYESTVFPGATDDIFIPELQKYNKLIADKDFYVGYSPERINPGDKKNTLDKIIKITSSNTNIGLKKVNNIYSKIIKAGIFPVKNIKTAELSKVLENTQRFVNIALINEISVLCKKLSINTQEVLKAASTKWNFINFKPGLVGGHCIAVDPLYLLYKTNRYKFPNDIISSSQKINRYMSNFIINEINKIKKSRNRTLILGIAFKENCRDTRNSGVFDLIKNLNKLNITPDVYDPLISTKPITGMLNYNFLKKINKKTYENIILAVSHDEFKKIGIKKIKQYSTIKQVKIFDINSAFNKKDVYFQL